MTTTPRELPNTAEARHAYNRVDGLEQALEFVPAGSDAAAAIEADLADARQALEDQYAAREAQQAEARANRDAGRLTVTPGRIA